MAEDNKSEQQLASATTTQATSEPHNVANAKNQRIAAAARQKDDAPAEIAKHLSKKNTDYVFKLKKGLAATDLSAERQKVIIDEMLPKIIEGQHQGKTANVLFGPVSERIDKILHAPVPAKPTPFWMSAIDMGCTFLAMFAAVYGLFGLFSPKMAKSATNGWITLIAIALAAGALMAYSTKWVNNKKRGSFLRILVVSLAAVFVMMVILSLIMMIPRQINFIVPPVPELILAAVAYGAHYLLKKHFKPLGYFRE